MNPFGFLSSSWLKIDTTWIPSNATFGMSPILTMGLRNIGLEHETRDFSSLRVVLYRCVLFGG